MYCFNGTGHLFHKNTTTQTNKNKLFHTNKTNERQKGTVKINIRLRSSCKTYEIF